MSKILIVLPCRLGSTRLAEKHLIELSNGKTIFEMTYNSCISSKADKVIIATDDERISTRAKQFTDDVVMTASTHNTGSDRVAEVASMYPEYDIVLNIQGDEPLVNTASVDLIIDGIIESDEDTVMCTAKTRFSNTSEILKYQNVKVVTDSNDKALYFSRSVIPFDRQANIDNSELSTSDYFKHLGLYAYKRDFLLRYVTMPQTFCEKKESLEQLRILENGYRIKVLETNFDSIGIDTPNDLETLEDILQDQTGKQP